MVKPRLLLGSEYFFLLVIRTYNKAQTGVFTSECLTSPLTRRHLIDIAAIIGCAASASQDSAIAACRADRILNLNFRIRTEPVGAPLIHPATHSVKAQLIWQYTERAISVFSIQIVSPVCSGI